MLWRRLNNILQFQSSVTRHSQNRSLGVLKSKCPWRNLVFSAYKPDPMSSFRLRLILREYTVTRLWNAYFRTQLVNSVVRRCRRDRFRVWACLRQTLLRPHRTLVLTVAAYNQDDEDTTMPCSQDISDEDLEALVHDFEGVDELSRATLFCPGCEKRLVVDRKRPGQTYCTCSNTHPPPPSEDGWAPYMEADDVIIWRKEYKPGGLFAYKVYGRYKDVEASDFAKIQVDGAYRRSWDDAVAALVVVEPEAGGVASQAVLHWEVLWPRLFANRDYVYLRRHKEFDVKSKCLAHKEAIFGPPTTGPCVTERPNVHTRAKMKSLELERKQGVASGPVEDKMNKVYVIVSRSCTHPSVPETRHAVRVQEYWSHMAVRTLDGPGSVGMEFVLTYYDEPSVGGLPSGVSAWATGRAAPSYLARMHRAALHYRAWCATHTDPPDFAPFDAEQGTPRPVGHYPRRAPALRVINELDMESSNHGPELDEGYEPRHKGTQTDALGKKQDVGVDASKRPAKTDTDFIDIKVQNVTTSVNFTEKVKKDDVKVKEKAKSNEKAESSDEVKNETVEGDSNKGSSKESESNDADSERTEEQTEESEGEETSKSSWWRYLYPFYYFV